MLLVWLKCAQDVGTERQQTSEQKSGSLQSAFSPVMICVMLAIILMGMLRDGVTTWMPTYIAETYNLSSVISILTGVILPLFSILSFQVVGRLHRKQLTNPVFCAGVVFGVGALAALGLYLFTGANAASSVVLSAALTGCMHGVNLMLICMVPSYLKSTAMFRPFRAL